MRTHIFNQMTAREIKDYLASGKDAIFVALGSTAAHGSMPVEADSVMAEALAKTLAEKSDAVVLTGLPFFYPGEAVISPATVYTSMRDNYEYLWKILKSLINQGFKKLFLVPCSDDIAIMLAALVRDFFEATHIHPVVITLMNVLSGAKKHNSADIFGGRAAYEKERQERLKKALPDDQALERMICGAYDIMGKKDQLIVDPNLKNVEVTPLDPAAAEFAKRAKRFNGSAAEMRDDSDKIPGGYVFKSVEERDQVCAEYAKKLIDAVDFLDMAHLLKVVGDYQEYSLKVCEAFPRFGKLAENR